MIAQADVAATVVEAEAPARYAVPAEPLHLLGPVVRPAPGTLPLRGDLAHVALAQHYLVQNYVEPAQRVVGSQVATLRLQPSDGATVVTQLLPTSAVEALDQAGDWAWVCCGAEGPTGYLRVTELAPAV